MPPPKRKSPVQPRTAMPQWALDKVRGKKTKDAPAFDDTDILEEIRANWDYDLQNWDAIRAEGDTDVRYVSGDTWDAEDEAKRAGRPMLKFDQLNQHLNRLVNTVRQNRRAIKVSPRGNGATDQTAETLANRIRDIEYESNGQSVYTTAFENEATRSYGFCRIVAEYEDDDPDNQNQVLRLKAIPNPNQVLPDSDAEIPTGKDWKRLFFVYTVSHKEFERDWPDAKIQNFGRDLQRAAPAWIKDTRVQIAEYWKVIETKQKSGRPKRKVVQYLTNGVEILDRKDWKGKYIPFAACLGKVLYRTSDTGEAEKIILSYVRLARDGAKAYNWVKSTEYEELSMIVKAPLHAYEGQMSPENVELVEKSTYSPVGIIFSKATLESLPPGTVLPLPQKPVITLNTAAYEGAGESARRDIQNALGQYSVPDRRMGPTKVVSGTALQELEKSGDLGTYHYLDSYDHMLQFIGEQLVDLIPYYDDTAKEISTRRPDGTMQMVQVNTPTQRNATGDLEFGPQDVNLKQGKHVATISTGPSFDSEREMARELAMSLLNNPQMAIAVAPEAVRLMNVGPEGEKMAENLEALQPPAVQAARAARDGKIDPKQLLAQNQQLKKQVQELRGLVGQAQAELKSKTDEYKNKLDVQTLKSGTDLHLAEMNNETKETVAELGAKTERDGLFYEERARIGIQNHEAGIAAADAGHEAHMADLTHGQNLVENEQQAALAPPPAPSDQGTNGA